MKRVSFLQHCGYVSVPSHTVHGNCLVQGASSRPAQGHLMPQKYSPPALFTCSTHSHDRLSHAKSTLPQSNIEPGTECCKPCGHATGVGLKGKVTALASLQADPREADTGLDCTWVGASLLLVAGRLAGRAAGVGLAQGAVGGGHGLAGLVSKAGDGALAKQGAQHEVVVLDLGRVGADDEEAAVACMHPLAETTVGPPGSDNGILL